MNQNKNIFVDQIFTQTMLGLIVLIVSLACVLYSINILPIGCVIASYLIYNGVRLYRIYDKGNYTIMIGTCVTVESAKFKKRHDVSFRMENGVFLKMVLKGHSFPIENEEYVFYLKKKPSYEFILASDVLAWAISEPIDETKKGE
ncbi:MAG: hypothetical protein KHY19_18095 [Coprobacillus cateniformis]|nr:hypothetical protein [Coprobacillus cateniformis]